MDKYEVLRTTFGYDAFRPGQEEICDALIGGRNVLAVMPTGSGKSLCFQVPALARGGLAIVVSPLVALMQDQVAALKLLDVEASTINSSQSREDNVETWRAVVAGQVSLLYLSPERLMTPRMIEALARLDVKLIAVDEAHCISQWGAAFRPEYDMLGGLREAFPGVPIGAFTATADQATRNDIVAKLFGDKAMVFVAGFDRPNIRLAVSPKDNSKRQLLSFVDGQRGHSGIVYSLSRKSTEENAAALKAAGHDAIAYHAGLDAEIRSTVQDRFMTDRAVIVCATIAFGMGIDKPDVRFVFHSDLPSSLDAYYQEIGRAGRDGKPAEAQLVFGLQDIVLRRRFIDQEEGGEERRRREHRRLDALVSYCEAPSCRRQALLSYFGEASNPCGNCDVCLSPLPLIDGIGEARLVFDAMTATGGRFGAGHVIDVLEGKTNARAETLGHTRLQLFGSGRATRRGDWQAIIRQLIGAGFIAVDVAGFGGMSLTPKAEALRRGDAEFRYRAIEAKKATKATRPAAAVAQELDVSDALLQRLKALRAKLARQRKVPAFVIFNDRTLIDMAAKTPRNRVEFAGIHGVGEAKLGRFADIFLSEIARA